MVAGNEQNRKLPPMREREFYVNDSSPMNIAKFNKIIYKKKCGLPWSVPLYIRTQNSVLRTTKRKTTAESS